MHYIMWLKKVNTLQRPAIQTEYINKNAMLTSPFIAWHKKDAIFYKQNFFSLTFRQGGCCFLVNPTNPIKHLFYFYESTTKISCNMIFSILLPNKIYNCFLLS